MHDHELLARWGLKYNPFTIGTPVDDLWQPPNVEKFFFRVEDLVMNGGFALISGESGLGKSKILQLLYKRFGSVADDVVVRPMERPQSNLSDFYRELGQLFEVPLSVANRYRGFKALREIWHQHICSTLFRPVLLVDESQEMSKAVLTELRLLTSVKFDSACWLTIVLCGDQRLPEKFRHAELIPLGSRIRTRLDLKPWAADELYEFLEHITEKAGSTHLMTDGLKKTLSQHAAGNLRVLCSMADELLHAATRKEEAKCLNESLYLEVFSREPTKRRQKRQNHQKH